MLSTLVQSSSIRRAKKWTRLLDSCWLKLGGYLGRSSLRWTFLVHVAVLLQLLFLFTFLHWIFSRAISYNLRRLVYLIINKDLIKRWKSIMTRLNKHLPVSNVHFVVVWRQFRLHLAEIRLAHVVQIVEMFVRSKQSGNCFVCRKIDRDRSSSSCLSSQRSPAHMRMHVFIIIMYMYVYYIKEVWNCVGDIMRT